MLLDTLAILLSSLFYLLSNPIIAMVLVIGIITVIQKHKEDKKRKRYQPKKMPSQPPEMLFQPLNRRTLKKKFYENLKNARTSGSSLQSMYLKDFETNGTRFIFDYLVIRDVVTKNGKKHQVKYEVDVIDLLMISPKGIFVFESKDYINRNNGRIFGNETQKNWYQILPMGWRLRQYKPFYNPIIQPFYNPIIQNRLHIQDLKTTLGEQVPMWSIIVFPERCQLKNIQFYSNDIHVINRDSIVSVVSGIYNQIQNDLLTQNDITEICRKLWQIKDER